MPLPPPPANLPPPPVEGVHVRLGSVVAALAKLNIKVSVDDLFKITREVDEATCTKFTAEEFQKCKPATALHPISDN